MNDGRRLSQVGDRDRRDHHGPRHVRDIDTIEYFYRNLNRLDIALMMIAPMVGHNRPDAILCASPRGRCIG
jgi:hypothetical protein